jgi:hypothetical protein
LDLQNNVKHKNDGSLFKLFFLFLSDRVLGDWLVSPILQATQQAVRQKRISQNLGKKLQTRPTREQLINQNILKSESLITSF